MYVPKMGAMQYPITTAAASAQPWFDQGLTFYFGFNHEEAILSFTRMLKEDPACAMAYWGLGISAGPHINNPVMDEVASKAAYEATTEAMKHRDSGTAKEKALIEALATRYAWPAPEDRAPLDSAYADAMGTVWAAYPDDPTVGALYAEALMDLRPWDLWTSDGEPQPGALQVVDVLERVLELDPNQPGANHFYIHAMEASPHFAKALPAANRLRTLVPGAGHLVHMPGHIDLRLGHYADAIRANQAATAVDEAYVAETGRGGGFYSIYRAHNYHFLAYAAMFDGQKALALSAADDLVHAIPMEVVLALADYLDAFISVPIHVMVRFGMWDELLQIPVPVEGLYGTQAFRHYGRTVAYAAKGDVANAETEYAALVAALPEIPETRLWGNNTMADIGEIGRLMAEGELAYRKGEHDKAFALLREAVERDEALRYDEPWGWMQPVSHALGALLLEQGRLDEALAVYRRDLELHPNNGWALQGLAEAQERRGQTAEAAKTRAKFQESWARSDITIKASCYCRTAAE